MEHIFVAKRKADEFYLAERERVHVRVLRIVPPCEILFTDCEGSLYKGRLEIDWKISAFDKIENAKEESVNLYFGLCDKTRTKFILEKCTELGVRSFNPIITEKSEKYSLSVSRVESILESAVKQSRRFVLPIYNEPVKLKDIDFTKMENIVFGSLVDKNRNLEYIKGVTNAFIGPPLGFTEGEEEFLTKNGGMPFFFDTAVLRTETFAVSLLAVIHYIKGRNNG